MSTLSVKLYNVLKSQTLSQILVIAAVLGNWKIPPHIECRHMKCQLKPQSLQNEEHSFIGGCGKTRIRISCVIEGVTMLRLNK